MSDDSQVGLTKQEKLRMQAEQHQKDLAAQQVAVKQVKGKRKMMIIGIAAAVLIIIIVIAVVTFARPGPYDSFAKCLSVKKVEVYGSMSWCKYTQAQKAMFGKSFKYLNYYDVAEWPADTYGDIKVTPTWIVNGELYPNVQDFERLSALTGCQI